MNAFERVAPSAIPSSFSGAREWGAAEEVNMKGEREKVVLSVRWVTG